MKPCHPYYRFNYVLNTNYPMAACDVCDVWYRSRCIPIPPAVLDDTNVSIPWFVLHVSILINMLDSYIR